MCLSKFFLCVLFYVFCLSACVCASERANEHMCGEAGMFARRLSPSIAVPLQCVCMVVDSVDGNV